jgi:adenylate kinase family enzyme
MNKLKGSLSGTAEAVLLMGPTGSGKTPLGLYLEQEGMAGRRCHHFDFGHELRQLASAEKPPEDFSQAEHQFIRDVLEKGLLLEDGHFSIAEKIIENFLDDRGYGRSDLLILNGLPRHIGQAGDMAKLVNIICLFVLECTAEDVCKRIDMNTGGDRTHRTDDAEAMIRNKLDIYNSRTALLIDYYLRQDALLLKMRVDPFSTAKTLYSRCVSFFSSAS